MNKIISDRIKKSYRNKEVIVDFSFEVQEGKITLLSGQNGCGKTTWIKIAIGLERQDDGQVLFNGKRIDDLRNEIGIVFDEPPVYPHLSGYDNLQQLSGVINLKNDFVKEILSDLKLEHSLLRKKGRSLSLGERHRLAVACALIRNPKFLILDEPAVGLDFESWEMVKKILRKKRELGAVILLTGHNYDMMEEICDEIILVDRGIVIYQGSLNDLLDNDKCEVIIETENNNLLNTRYDLLSIGSNKYKACVENEMKAKELLKSLQEDYNVVITNFTLNKSNLKSMYQKKIRE